jgi:hypothetical protein
MYSLIEGNDSSYVPLHGRVDSKLTDVTVKTGTVRTLERPDPLNRWTIEFFELLEQLQLF